MHRYAMLIRKSDLPLLTILNGGREPEMYNRRTYLVFCIEDSEHSHTELMSERELLRDFEISSRGPLLLKLKK